MMKMLVAAAILVVLITIIVLLVKSTKNRLKLLNIKLKEADSNINLYLQKKKTTLDNIIKIIIDLKKDEGLFDDFSNDTKKEKNTFVLHSVLNKYYSKLSKLLLDDEELSKNSDILEHLINLKNNEEELIGSIKFYNDSVVDYNGLIKTFPHKVFAKVKSLDNKDFYNNEKEELFDILK